jgi:streptogrisin C
MARTFVLLAVAIAPALSVPVVAAQPEHPAVETLAQALAEDADQYAAQFQVNRAEALRRLDAQQASVATTDAIAREFAGRLAGIAIEHVPEYRIVVLLTGTQAVAERTVAGIPIIFRTGAKATRSQAIAAMKTHLVDLRSELPGLRGAGYDQRTGEIVLLIRPEDAQHLGIDAIRARAEQVGGVPVRVVVNDLLESNMAIDGGERVDGVNGETGRRNICTSGFVVTDGVRGGIATAAHCPDELTYHAPDGSSLPLAFAGQWGLAYQDVQINLSPGASEPIFRATGSAGSLRRVATWRNRGSTRAGDFVCHFGESSGYSCAQVELTDYAPPGALCGGPCEPTWVTVRGPGCIGGDSGGPVFSGSVAFGIAKGINRSSSGRCNFYYYMSTDYLPPPWRLLTTGDAISPRPDRP